MILQRGGLIKFPEQKSINLLSHPDRLSTTSTIYDEEFDSPSKTVSPYWTIATGGTNSYNINTTYPSCLYINLLMASGSAVTMSNINIPNTTTSVTACGYLLPMDNGNLFHLYLGDIDGANGIYLRSIGGAWSTYMNYIEALNQTTGTYARVGLYLDVYRLEKTYLHLQKIGNTCSYWYSTNGLSWTNLYTFSKTFTQARARTAISAGIAAPNTYVSGAIDWVRFNWITL